MSEQPVLVTDSDEGHAEEGMVRIHQGTGHIPFPATPGPPPPVPHERRRKLER